MGGAAEERGRSYSFWSLLLVLLDGRWQESLKSNTQVVQNPSLRQMGVARSKCKKGDPVALGWSPHVRADSGARGPVYFGGLGNLQ
jgi:hypothetical protein